LIDTCLHINGYNKVLFLAIGGGGDVALASTLALSYERCGKQAIVGSIIWERYSVDPVPGPISIDELFNTVKKTEDYAIVNANTFAIRGGRVVIPQPANVSKFLKRNVIVFELSKGAKGLARAIENYMNSHGIEAVIGVDVGGDSLAEGFEDELWSPLADGISVAALAHIKGSYLAVVCPGADGELSLNYIEKRLRRIARLNGYLGGYILSRKDLEVLRNILIEVISEASTIPLTVLSTDLDNIVIRNGSREVRLSIMNLAVFLLDAVTVARDTVARYIYDTDSFNEAKWILNKLGIVTEYDIEEEIFNEIVQGRNCADIDLVEIRNRLKNRLIKLHKPNEK